MKRLALLVGVLGLALTTPAVAAKTNGSCNSLGQTVNATGLPTETVINFLVVDSTGTIIDGWVLGITHDGTWTVLLDTTLTPLNVPMSTYATPDYIYRFVSKGTGRLPKYRIYAECN